MDNFSRNGKLATLKACYLFARLDGELSQQENECIEQLAQTMNISESDLNEFDKYRKAKDKQGFIHKRDIMDEVKELLRDNSLAGIYNDSIEYAAKNTMVWCLINLICADGRIDSAENDAIHEVANDLGIEHERMREFFDIAETVSVLVRQRTWWEDEMTKKHRAIKVAMIEEIEKDILELQESVEANIFEACVSIAK